MQSSEHLFVLLINSLSTVSSFFSSFFNKISLRYVGNNSRVNRFSVFLILPHTISIPQSKSNLDVGSQKKKNLSTVHIFPFL